MTSEQTPPKNQETLLGQYAGFVTRMLGFILDRLILGAIIALITMLAGFLLNLFDINQFLGTEELARLIMIILALVVILLIILSYHIGFWLLAGQTPGQRLMGVRIVRTNGDRVTFWPALGRFLGYFVSSILFLGFLWVLVDDRRQGFHDKIAGTVALYAWPEGKQRGTFVRDSANRFRRRQEIAQTIRKKESMST
jgi:uncharacterized RDD family membrane protein YckC